MELEKLPVDHDAATLIPSAHGTSGEPMNVNLNSLL